MVSSSGRGQPVRAVREQPPQLFPGAHPLAQTADEKLHAPNEYLRIRRLREGMRAWDQLWRLLARGSDPPEPPGAPMAPGGKPPDHIARLAVGPGASPGERPPGAPRGDNVA